MNAGAEAGGPRGRHQPAKDSSSHVSALIAQARSARVNGSLDVAAPIYSELLNRFGEHRDQAVRRQVLVALSEHSAWLQRQGRPRDALTVIEEVLKRAVRDPPAVDSVLWVDALIGRANALYELQHLDESLAAYDEVYRRLRDDNDLRVARKVSSALAFRGRLLEERGRPDEAIEAFEQLADRYSECADPEIRLRTATCLLHRAEILRNIGRAEEGLALHRRLAARYGSESSPDLRLLVARALHAIADAAQQSEDGAGASAVCAEIIRRYKDAHEPELRAEAAYAAVFDAIMRETIDPEAALARYEQVVSQYGMESSVPVKRRVADAMERRASLLMLEGRHGEALAAYREVLERYGHETVGGFEEIIARSLTNRAVLLASEGSQAEAMVIGEALSARLDEQLSDETTAAIARGLLNYAIQLARKGQQVAAIDIDDRLIDALAGCNDTAVRRNVALALNHKTEVLGLLGRIDEAHDTHKLMVELYGDDALAAFDDAALQVKGLGREAALILKRIGVLLELGRDEEAAEACDDLITRFGEWDDADVQQLVAMAVASRRELDESED